MRASQIQIRNVGCSLVFILAMASAVWAWIYQGLWVYSNWNPMPFGFMCLWGGLAVFFLAAHGFSPAWRLRIAMSAGSSLVSLCLLEMALGSGMVQSEAETRKALSDENESIAARHDSFDERTLQQVVFQLRASGKDAWPVYYPGLGLIAAPLYPLSGLSSVTTVYGNESGQFFIYESDEHGFNNPGGEHGKSETDLVVIGDSFAHGCCAEAGSDVGNRLREKGWTVLNLGMAGHGPLEELGTLLEYGAGKRPATVLWLYYEENDLDDLGNEARIESLASYLSPGFTQELIRRQEEADAIVRNWLKDRLAAHDPSLAVDSPPASRPSLVSDETRDSPPPERIRREPYWFRLITLDALTRRIRRWKDRFHAPIDPLFKQVLRRAQSVTGEWGGELLFVYLPGWHRYYFGKANDDSFQDRDQVLQAVRELGVPVIDFQETVNRMPDPMQLFPFRKHGHYTAEGYQLLSDRIDQTLRVNGVMPLKPSL